MAGVEAPRGSGSRRRMDLNLYLGLPPLPRPPGRRDVDIDYPAPALPNSADSVPEAPRTDGAGGLLPPLSAVYSSSNALSIPDAAMIDPMIFEWLNGHSVDSGVAIDAVEPVVSLDVLSDGANLSPPPLAGLRRNDMQPVRERVSRLGSADPAGSAAEMISVAELRHSIGVVAMEATAPELRLQRLIHLSEQHHIVRPRPVSHSQRASSPEADRLARAIQRSHSSLDVLKRKKLDGDGKAGGTDAVNKDGCCACNSFECNICLEAAREPVVTPCGHLFCWPCLYQWLHGHSVHSECPVCKGEVLEVNVTPIYGRGGGERKISSNDVPPRPQANRSESLRQQLQMPDPRGIASMVRRLISNQDIVRGHAAPLSGVEVTVLPAGRSRTRGSRQQRQDNNALPSVPAIVLHVDVGNAAPENGDNNPLPSSNTDNAALAVPTAPQQSASMEQTSHLSTMAVIVGEPMQGRRTRPSESTGTRRTRRRQQ